MMDENENTIISGKINENDSEKELHDETENQNENFVEENKIIDAPVDEEAEEDLDDLGENVSADENVLVDENSAELEQPGEEKLVVSGKYNLTTKEAIKQAKELLNVEKETKVVRDCPWKKLPDVFKRTYSERALKRKLLKKIYIPEDRLKVESLFVLGANEKHPNKVAVSKDLMFSKKEIKKLRSLAREIRNQSKLMIRLIPLVMVVAVIGFAISWVMMNKNRLVRNAIISGCQGIFKAKTEIDYVSVKIFDTSITIGGLRVGNKNQVMKNLFEINRIQLDFDLVQLLKKNFVCENLEASGIAWNTDRKTSCELSGVPQNESAFSREVKARFNNAIKDLQNQAYDLLGGSDVESIIKNVQDNINTPELVQQTIEDMTLLYEKWKEKPAEYKIKIDEFSDSVKNLRTINLTSFDIRKSEDIAKLKDALEKINTALVMGQALGDTVQKAVLEVKNDAENVASMAKNVTDTVKSDYDYIVTRLTTVVGTLANLDGLLNNAINTVAYNMLGKYYPYVVDGLDLVRELKANSDSKPKKEKKASRRAAGTEFNFIPVYPSFLIKNIKVSGTGFDCVIKEITNNQNVRYKTTTADLTLDIKNVIHKGHVTVDIRKNSNAPLVALSYDGAGYPVGIVGTSIAAKRGVPSIDGLALLSVSASFGSDGFSAQGSVDLNPVSLTTDGFENEFVTKYYQVGLAAIDNLRIGFDLGYNTGTGLYLKLLGNFGEQFLLALKDAAFALGRDAKQAALKKLEEYLNNSENEIIKRAKEFLGIEGDIDLQNASLNDVKQALLVKKAEIEKMIGDKIQDATDQVVAKVEEKTSEVMTKVEEKTSEAMSKVEEKTNEVVSAIGNKIDDTKNQITNSINDAITSSLGIKKKDSKNDSEENPDEENLEEENSTDEENGETGSEKNNPPSMIDTINSMSGGLWKGFGR